MSSHAISYIAIIFSDAKLSVLLIHAQYVIQN